MWRKYWTVYYSIGIVFHNISLHTLDSLLWPPGVEIKLKRRISRLSDSNNRTPRGRLWRVQLFCICMSLRKTKAQSALWSYIYMRIPPEFASEQSQGEINADIMTDSSLKVRITFSQVTRYYNCQRIYFIFWL